MEIKQEFQVPFCRPTARLHLSLMSLFPAAQPPNAPTSTVSGTVPLHQDEENKYIYIYIRDSWAVWLYGMLAIKALTGSQTNFIRKYLLGFVSSDKYCYFFRAHTECNIPAHYFLFNSFNFYQHIVQVFLPFSIPEFHSGMENQGRHIRCVKLVCLPKWLIKPNP